VKKSIFVSVLLGMSSLCFPDVGMAEKTVQISPDAFKTENIVIATAIAGTLSDHMDVPAYVALDERHVARIHPVGNGRVQEVFVTPGEKVQKGAPLFKYENFSHSISYKWRLLMQYHVSTTQIVVYKIYQRIHQIFLLILKLTKNSLKLKRVYR